MQFLKMESGDMRVETLGNDQWYKIWRTLYDKEDCGQVLRLVINSLVAPGCPRGYFLRMDIFQ